MSNSINAVELLMSDNRGQYIPRDWAEECTDNWTGVTSEQRLVLQSPENEDYWEVWEEVLNNAKYTDEFGEVWTLYQDGDLWAINLQKMTNEEKRNFEFEVTCLNCDSELHLNGTTICINGAWSKDQNVCSEQCLAELVGEGPAQEEVTALDSPKNDEFSTRACDKCGTCLGGRRDLLQLDVWMTDKLDGRSFVFVQSVCIDCLNKEVGNDE